MNEVLEVIRGRRSIRKYRPEQIESAKLDLILESGLWAPSGHNVQPWHFLVVQDAQKLNEMSDKVIALMNVSPHPWVRKLAAGEGYHLFHRAPTVVIVSGKKALNDLDFSMADCSAATQNMLLAAHSLEIGSCWVGLAGLLFDSPEETAGLGIPTDYQPLYAVCLGYKEEDFTPKAPPRKDGRLDYYKS